VSAVTAKTKTLLQSIETVNVRLGLDKVEEHSAGDVMSGPTLSQPSTLPATIEPKSTESTIIAPLTIKHTTNGHTALLDAYKEMCATDEITRVCDGLYVSGFDVLTSKKLIELDIRFIINATSEKPNLLIPNVDVLKLDILDKPLVNIRGHMDICADRIHAVKKSGGQTLVHCALGISRSVTMCLAYLVKYERQTLRDAYFSLKKKRPRIHPNDGFWRQLIWFEADITKGPASVKMLSYPGGSIPSVYPTSGNRSMFRAAMSRK